MKADRLPVAPPTPPARAESDNNALPPAYLAGKIDSPGGEESFDVKVSHRSSTLQANEDYITLEMLCAGLARIRLDHQRVQDGTPLQSTTQDGPALPQAWRAARRRLWWMGRAAGLNWPRNDLNLFAHCRVPLSTWPVGLSLAEGDLTAVLLDGDELSEFAEEAAALAGHADVEAELVQNQTFRALVTCAQRNGTSEREVQRNYVRLRRLLIAEPVLSDRRVLALARIFPAAEASGELFIRQFLGTAYTFRPEPGKVRLAVCQGCGNPADGAVGNCPTPGCTGPTGTQTFETLDGYWLQHRATRRFFHDPGLVETRILDRLAELPPSAVEVEAWPLLDAWDGAVTFVPSAPGHPVERWVIDAKDCASPTQLARGFSSDARIMARRRIIVLPMHRDKVPGYRTDLVRELDGRVSGIEVLNEEEFVRQVTRRALQVVAR